MWILIILGAILALFVALWIVGKIVGAIIGLAMLLIVAGLAGAAAQSLLKYPGGFTFAFAAGLIGAVVGTVLAHLFHFPLLLRIGGLPVLWTLVGAIIVVAVAKVILPRRVATGSISDRYLR